MSTQTPREKLQEEHFFIRSKTEIVDWLAKEVWTLNEDALVSCVDTLLEEARQDMKEKCIKVFKDKTIPCMVSTNEWAIKKLKNIK